MEVETIILPLRWVRDSLLNYSQHIHEDVGKGIGIWYVRLPFGMPAFHVRVLEFESWL